MTIGFQHIPSNIRVPGTFFDIDPSNANTGQQQIRALLIGQVLPGSPHAAAGVAGTPFFCTGTGDTKTGAGAGSMLSNGVARFKNRYSFGELWVLPVVDDPAAVAASGTITVAGTATAAGTLPNYINFMASPALVTAGMTAAQAAAALNVAINSLPDMPVTATVAGAVVTLTAKNKGLAGNDIDVRSIYYGTAGGEAIPAGLTVTIAPMSGGTTNPSLTSPLLNLAEIGFEVILCPYSDTANLNALQQMMADDVGRWSWQRKLFGHCYVPKAANLSQATTFGPTRNDQHVSVLPIGGCPLSPPDFIADAGAAIMERVSVDPSLPLQYLTTNIPPPVPSSRFLPADRNVLLFDGLSTYKVVRGVLELERMVTTYQVNVAGAPDTSYLDCETMHTLGFVCRDYDTFLTTKFLAPGYKLVADNFPIPGGVKMVNPSVLKASIDAHYRYLCDPNAGPAWCQDPDGFAKESRVELAGLGRVNIYAPFRIMGQLRIMALSAAFTKPS